MISFIIPAYNEERLLGRTLEAIHHAAKAVREEYEVIVVDDHSSDRTGAVATTHGATVIPVNFRHIAATRNAGAHAAKGSQFIFVDADTVISAEILAATVAAFRDGGVGGGAAFRFDGEIPLYGKILQWLVYQLYRLGKVASGSYLFCTRSAFEHTSGFDETAFGSEEAIMSWALRKYGRFVVLPHTVLTSGRKLRLHSCWEILGIIAHVALSGGKVSNRNAARIWYDGKREAVEDEGILQ